MGDWDETPEVPEAFPRTNCWGSPHRWPEPESYPQPAADTALSLPVLQRMNRQPTLLDLKEKPKGPGYPGPFGFFDGWY